MTVNIRKLNKENFTILFILVLLCLLGCSHLQGIRILSLLFTTVIILIGLLTDVDTLFIIMYACLPFYNLMNFEMGTYSMHYLIVGLFSVKYFFTHAISYKKILCFLTLLLLRIFAADFVLLVSWSLLLWPLILTYGDDIWRRNMYTLMQILSVSMILSSLFGYFMMIRGSTIYTNAYLYIGDIRTIRFAGVSGDSIIYGESAVLVIASNLVCAYLKPKEKTKHLICAAFLAFFCLLTFSKLTVICLAFAFFCYFVLEIKKTAKSKRTFAINFLLLIFGTAVVILGLSFLVTHSKSHVVLGYIERFTRDDLGTGRNGVWSHYLDIMTANMKYLFLPMTNSLYETSFYNSSTNSYIWHAHNLYLETICVFGWIGGITVIAWVISQIVGFLRKKRQIILILPLTILLFVGFGAHGNLEYQFYLQLAYALAPLKMDFENSQKEVIQYDSQKNL